MLSVGTVVGPYEVLGAIGAGGMGEVYRARDTKLGREVALKVLPDLFAADADRLARFEREAHVLASLSHPNIAAIHGIEESGGVRALVLELVKGETLAERLANGPMPLDEVRSVARQIADALDAAHGQGVVHRDLKPANIAVTPQGVVKVLDFGLAKLAEPSTGGSLASPVPLSMSPTTVSPAFATNAGVLLGTAAYMSPEQVRGSVVDKRTDIWAFGCILHEMLTGRPLFAGQSVSDTISHVLTMEPDSTRVPAPFRSLLHGCLERDRDRRLRDIGDAWRLLDQPTPLASRPVAPWAAALLAAVATAVAGSGWWLVNRESDPAASPSVRLAMDLGRDAEFGTDFPVAILSPDGTRVVFVSRGPDRVSRLSTRELDESEATPLAGTEGAYAPFFSPDGQWIGFFGGGKLKKTRLDGGTAVVLCEGELHAYWDESDHDQVYILCARASDPTEVSGMLPFSRMTSFRGNRLRSVTDVRLLWFPVVLFPEMMQRMPLLVQRLVGIMSDRVRESTTLLSAAGQADGARETLSRPGPRA